MGLKKPSNRFPAKKSNSNAIPCIYKGIRFDSILERDTYMILSTFFGNDSVQIKPTIQIIPKNNLAAALNWKPDFRVNGFIYEAKGILEKDFRLRWKVIMLLQDHIAYSTTFVVGDYSSKDYLDTFKRVTKQEPIKLSNLKNYLENNFFPEGEF